VVGEGGLMIKKLKDWRLLLLVCVFMSYGLLLMTMINDFYELPSEGFSKEVLLREYEKPNTYEAYDDKSFTSGPLDNGFYILINDGNQLIYEVYSELGERQLSSVIVDGTDVVVDISSITSGDVIQYVFATENQLVQGELNSSDGKVLSNKIIADAYDKAVLHGNSVVFSDGVQYYYFNDAVTQLFQSRSIKQFDYVALDKQLIVTTISRDTGAFFTDVYNVSLDTAAVEKTFVREYITSNATKDADHQLILDNTTIRTMSIFRDSRTGSAYYKELKFPMSAPTEFEFSKFDTRDFPNFKYKNVDGNTVTMFMEKFTFVGKDELASADSTYRNLVELTIDDEGIFQYKRLTKMKKAHPVYSYFDVSKNSYLVFNTVDSSNGVGKGSIYFATTQPDIVLQSNTLENDDLMTLIFGALTVLPAALAVGFIPSMGFVFPVILVIMPLSMIKITWAERYPKKMLRVAIGVYFVSLFWGFYDSAVMIMNKIGVMAGSMPWHLQTIPRMYGMLTITFGLSYLGYRWFDDKKPQSSFMIQYGVMFICQSVLYIMLFHAYPLLAN